MTPWACQIRAPDGTVPHSLAGREEASAASLWESLSIQNRNQMYRALDVGYGILLRLKEKRESMYLFDFIPHLKAHLKAFCHVLF